MKCPVCAAAEMMHDTRDVPYTYQGKTTVLPQITGNFCPACAEYILDLEETGRAMRLMGDFRKQANAGIADPGFKIGGRVTA